MNPVVKVLFASLFYFLSLVCKGSHPLAYGVWISLKASTTTGMFQISVEEIQSLQCKNRPSCVLWGGSTVNRIRGLVKCHPGIILVQLRICNWVNETRVWTEPPSQTMVKSWIAFSFQIFHYFWVLFQSLQSRHGQVQNILLKEWTFDSYNRVNMVTSLIRTTY